MHAQTANTDSLPLLQKLPYAVMDFEADNLGNLFIINENQQLKKLNQRLDSVGMFNNTRSYGKLYSMDVSNPLKILLYYKDFSTIVVIDRFLNIRTTIDLRQLGITQCSAIAQSYDNNIWLYDELEAKLKKIDEQAELLLESPDFRLITDQAPNFNRLIDFNKNLFAYDSTRGLMVLDYYGAYKNLIAFKGWHNLDAFAKGIVATDKQGIVYYQPGQIDTQNKVLPATILAAKKIRINGNKLYALFADNRLHIYQLP